MRLAKCFSNRCISSTPKTLARVPNRKRKSLPGTPSMTVFDRNHKLLQRERAANSSSADSFDYLKDYVALNLVERLDDLTREWPVAVDLGCNAGHCLKYVKDHGNIGHIINLDMSRAMLRRAQKAGHDDAVERVENGFAEAAAHRSSYAIADEESLPLQDNSCDLIISSMSLHWINDLPGALSQIHSALKPDGVFLAAMIGGATLNELRMSLVAAEQERDGGVSPRTSPLAQVSDVGSLLVGAGFKLPTVDTELVHCNFADAVTVMEHLKGMGDSNASLGRLMSTKRDTLLAAAAVYQTMYSSEIIEDELEVGEEKTLVNAGEVEEEDKNQNTNDNFSDFEGTAVPATFQIVYMIGWKQGATTPKALQPGTTPQRSLKDLGFSSDEFLAP
eukprot:g777.t1